LIGRIFHERAWFPKGDGYWTTSFDYQAKAWDIPRRIVVVRKDNRASHRRFTDKHDLKILLLSDEDHKVHEAYGAWGKKKN
ncbi:MAG: redoxin domain-containing protein, partial [Bacteroidales bacterium]|nr:redoxin domain-containing protein [Bacteroidales bacterium]